MYLSLSTPKAEKTIESNIALDKLMNTLKLSDTSLSNLVISVSSQFNIKQNTFILKPFIVYIL